MATRSRQYMDHTLRDRADYTCSDTSGTTNNNTGFIILPPWVADKIELAGGDLVDFFYGSDIPKVGEIAPKQNSSYIPYLSQVTPDIVNQKTIDLEFNQAQLWETRNNLREAATNRVRKYLSEEDIADIGLWHYLFSDALHLVNPLSGLCHEHEYAALLPLRNKYMTATTADGKFCQFGQVTIYNNATTPENSTSRYDVITHDMYSDARGLRFVFTIMPGVSLDGICKYAYDRITSICENIPERVNRSGDVVTVYGDKGSIVCVPHMATVSNVADMLSRFVPDDDIKRQKVESFNSAKERLLALIERIVAERRRWVGTHGCARDGLMVLYTRQL